MALVYANFRDALIDAGIDPARAEAAAAEVAHQRLGCIEKRLRLLAWVAMIGFALVLLVIGIICAVWLRLDRTDDAEAFSRPACMQPAPAALDVRLRAAQGVR